MIHDRSIHQFESIWDIFEIFWSTSQRNTWQLVNNKNQTSHTWLATLIVLIAEAISKSYFTWIIIWKNWVLHHFSLWPSTFVKKTHRFLVLTIIFTPRCRYPKQFISISPRWVPPPNKVGWIGASLDPNLSWNPLESTTSVTRTKASGSKWWKVYDFMMWSFLRINWPGRY